jgi:glycosyltransferase involved in cell wall biosynthesis
MVREAGVRYVREDAPGLDRARNRGLTAARFDIVAFTDDDVIVDAGWLRGLAGGFEDADVGGVTGLVVPATLDTEAELLFECGAGGMGKGMVPVRWDRRGLDATGVLGAQHVGVGANMAFRRELLIDLGGFDPGLDVGTPARGGGDLDVFHRALVAGAVIRYEPRALARHAHRRDMRTLQRQHFDSGCAFGVYLLTIFRRGAVPRMVTAWYALGVWLAWLVARPVKRALGREPLPLSLLVAELGGAMSSPIAWVRARRAVARYDRAAAGGQRP